MTADRALRMTCGGCGKVNEIDLPDVQEAARTEADKLTDAEVAKRYRAAMRLAVDRFVPQQFRRMPVAWIDRMSDEDAISCGRDVLTLMLTPTG